MTNEQLKILRQFLSDLTSADIYSPLILSNERSPGEELIPILRAVIEGASAVEPRAEVGTVVHHQSHQCEHCSALTTIDCVADFRLVRYICGKCGRDSRAHEVSSSAQRT